MNRRATSPAAFEFTSPASAEPPAAAVETEPARAPITAPATIALPAVQPAPTALSPQVQALLDEAQAMLDAGRARAAMVPLKRAATAAPKAPEVLLALAQGHARIGDDGPAVRVFDRLLAVKPGMVDALYGKALALTRLGQLAQARPLVQRLKGLRPDDVTVRRLAARVATPDQALAESLRAARTGDPRAALEHADRLARSGRVAESANFYQAAAKRAPKDAQLHLKWGTALAAGGRLAEAVSALQTATRADPKRAAAWQTLATVQSRMGDNRAAAATLEGMLKALPRMRKNAAIQARIDRLRGQERP